MLGLVTTGQRTNQVAVRIHVREKIPEHALEADKIFPKTIDGVPIDVVQAVYAAYFTECRNGSRPAEIKADENWLTPR
jgi:hypothetical protein